MRAVREQKCSICKDSFKNPKMISCHHTFCCKCLEDYVRVNLLNGRFDCPLCRTSVGLPKAGVAGFQANVYLDTASGEKFVCDVCGPKSMAINRCLVCEENLCQSCCYVHENSKATRNHKISELGTLDSEMKGKIRQRVFCDQHPEEELKLYCNGCNVLICVLCNAVSHKIHATETVTAAAAKLKKTLQTKLKSCSDKFRRISTSKEKGDQLDKSIDDAEREELKAVENQRLQIIQVLDQEVAKAKDKIKTVYHNLRQQNAAFNRDVQHELKTCSNAVSSTQTLISQGTDIEIMIKGRELETLISAVTSKTEQTANILLERKLFSPAKIKPSELTSSLGMMQDSTDFRKEREKKEKEEKEKKAREENERKSCDDDDSKQDSKQDSQLDSDDSKQDSKQQDSKAMVSDSQFSGDSLTHFSKQNAKRSSDSKQDSQDQDDSKQDSKAMVSDSQFSGDSLTHFSKSFSKSQNAKSQNAKRSSDTMCAKCHGIIPKYRGSFPYSPGCRCDVTK